jgi:hypothetical protein
MVLNLGSVFKLTYQKKFSAENIFEETTYFLVLWTEKVLCLNMYTILWKNNGMFYG